jgi:ankyrin repeat protein
MRPAEAEDIKGNGATMNEDAKHGTWRKENILDLDALAYRIAAGMDVKQRMGHYEEGYPLRLAAINGNAEACRLLLLAGANPNVAKGGWTSPLCEVIGERELQRLRKEQVMPDSVMREVFSVLVSHGTDPNGCQGPEGEMRSFESPLYLAAAAGDHEAVRALVELGANVNIIMKHSRTDAAMRHITEYTTTLDIMRHEGYWVAASPDHPMMATLLRLGADDACLANDKAGRTPFQEAVVVGRDKVVEYYVKERGEDIAQRVNGRTLAQMAREASTRVLLKSLKTELAVQHAVGAQSAGAPAVAVATKNRGIAL